MLTKRETEVTTLICDGLSCKQIADELGMAYKTVDCHRTRIMRKLNVHNTALLVRRAFENRLVNLQCVN